MTSKLEHIMNPVAEIALVTLGAFSAVSSRVLLAESAGTPEAQQFALQWLLLPLLGALAGALVARLMNPVAEPNTITSARAISATAVGTVVPKLISVVFPSLKDLALDPSIVFLAGFAVGLATYIVSRKFVERLYGNADGIANNLADKVTDKIMQKPVQKPDNTTPQ